MNTKLPQIVSAIDADIPSFISGLNNFKIQNDYDMSQANETLSAIKKRMKRIKEHRLFFTEPLKDQAKKIEAMFKPYEKKLEDLEIFIKSEMKRKHNEDKIQALKKLEKAKSEGEVLPMVQEPISAVKTSSGTTSFKRKWKAKVIEPEKVPIEYWIIDEKKIHEAVTHDGIREIPGVKIFEDIEVSTRA